MQPKPILTKHLVFKPNKQTFDLDNLPIGAAQDVRKTQGKALQAQTQGDLWYLQLVAEIPDAGASMETGEIGSFELNGSEQNVSD